MFSATIFLTDYAVDTRVFHGSASLLLRLKRSLARKGGRPSVCEDDVSVPDFGGGILGDLMCCQRDPSVYEFVDLVDDA